MGAIRLARLALLREALPSAVLIAGAGVNMSNLADFMQVADAVIVGSSIKTSGNFLDPLDPRKARQFMQLAHSLREKTNHRSN